MDKVIDISVIHYVWGIPLIVFFGLLYVLVTKDSNRELDAATELGNMP